MCFNVSNRSSIQIGIPLTKAASFAYYEEKKIDLRKEVVYAAILFFKVHIPKYFKIPWKISAREQGSEAQTQLISSMNTYYPYVALQMPGPLVS